MNINDLAERSQQKPRVHCSAYNKHDAHLGGVERDQIDDVDALESCYSQRTGIDYFGFSLPRYEYLKDF